MAQRTSQHTKRAVSAGCLPPLPPAQSFQTADQEFGSLREMSQSSDTVFTNVVVAAHSPRKLSKSEEAINTTAMPDVEEPELQQQSATDSNIDLYARATDESLEKHLSLFAVNSMTSINMSSYPGALPGSTIVNLNATCKVKNSENVVRPNVSSSEDKHIENTELQETVASSQNVKVTTTVPSGADDNKDTITLEIQKPKLQRQAEHEISSPVSSASSDPINIDFSPSHVFYVPPKIERLPKKEHKLSAKISDTSFPPQFLQLKSPRDKTILHEFTINIIADEEPANEMLLDDPFQAGRLSNASSYSKLPGSSPSATNSPKLVHSPSNVDRTNSETSTISSGSNFIANIDDTLSFRTANRGSLSDDILDQEIITDVLSDDTRVPDFVTYDCEVPRVTEESEIQADTSSDDDITEAGEDMDLSSPDITITSNNITLNEINAELNKTLTLTATSDVETKLCTDKYSDSEENLTNMCVTDENTGANDNYDINSNLTVTNSKPGSTESDDNSDEQTQKCADNSLKMRLKSLAMEYEVEDSKHQQLRMQQLNKPIHRYGSPVIHKRARYVCMRLHGRDVM